MHKTAVKVYKSSLLIQVVELHAPFNILQSKFLHFLPKTQHDVDCLSFYIYMALVINFHCS